MVEPLSVSMALGTIFNTVKGGERRALETQALWVFEGLFSLSTVNCESEIEWSSGIAF